MDGRLYALRWYSVDCVSVALVVARAVVGAREGLCVVGLYVVGGAVGGILVLISKLENDASECGKATVWQIASG